MALRISAYKGTDPTSDKQLLVDALVLPIFTYGPVDRVAESRGGWGESTQQEAGGVVFGSGRRGLGARARARDDGVSKRGPPEGGGGGDALTKAFLEGVQRIGEAESVRNARLL